MDFTSFEANAARSTEKRRMVVLRCEDAPLLGLFAPHVYQDLVGIGDAGERRSRIVAAVEGHSQALAPPRLFIGVPLLSRLLLQIGSPTEALALGEKALANHNKTLGLDHSWTKDSAGVTADALDALGRSKEANTLRETLGARKRGGLLA